jgi:hypothetical protein
VARTDTGPLVVRVALAVGALSVAIGIWASDDSDLATMRPPTAGLSTTVGDVDVQNGYRVPAPEVIPVAGTDGASERWDVVATLTISTPQGADRLVGVQIGGRPATLTPPEAAVTQSLLQVRPKPAPGDVRATVTGVTTRAGALVPVAFRLAQAGTVTVEAPVWPTATWPSGG